jgi:hypothetical protein
MGSPPFPTPMRGVADPAAAAVAADISAVRMRQAGDDGRYGIISHNHPVVVAWVDVQGSRLGLRLECSGYPGEAPAGQPWDLKTDTPLPVQQWPHGARAGMVFRSDWSVSNRNAPYLACDRTGLATHPNWRTEYPAQAWNLSKTLADYLEQVRGALRGSALPEQANHD